MKVNSSRAWSAGRDGDASGENNAEQHRLGGGDPGAGDIPLADPPRDHGGGRDGHTSGDGEENADHGLGEPHGGHGLGAEPGDEESIGEGEDRFHDHLENHGDDEQNDGPTDGPGGEVQLLAGERQLHRRPCAEVRVGILLHTR